MKPTFGNVSLNHPRAVEISLHGTSASVFDGVTRTPGSFARCMRAIRLLRERGVPLLLKTTAMTVNRDEVLAVKRYAEDLGVGYKLGEELRPSLDGSDAPSRWALSESELHVLNRQDADLWAEACRNRARAPSPCRAGYRSCHIDAAGRLQLCSTNRARGYDLRRGSFREGFYRHLSRFPCPARGALAEPSGSRA